MTIPQRFNVLLVRGDGRRVLRLRVSRSALGAVLGAAALTIAVVATSLGMLYRDYVTYREYGSTTALLSRLMAQRALIDLYDTRVQEVWTEIESWRAVHAKIWEPFSPAAGADRRTTGIGGRSAPSPFEPSAARGSVAEELARLASAVQEESEHLRSLERFFSSANEILASLPSRWPLRGSINSDFGKRLSPWAPNSEFHGGLDIGAAIGTPVEAPAPGTVVFAEALSEYGITVIVDHGNDTRSLYGHLSRLNVRVDERVERGQVIAWSGNTGRSSGPHLHYEIQVKGRPVNPHSYIWE
jgi:murein DD-endopeptidase MepM/ murein hydrolase activator NlpD